MTPENKAAEMMTTLKALNKPCDCLEYACTCFYIPDYMAKKLALITIEDIKSTLRNEDKSVDFANASKLMWWHEVKLIIESL